MALSKDKKKELIAEYSDALKDASTVVYVSFKGLNVKNTEQLRKELFNEGIKYKTVKKTLWNRALDTEKVAGEKPTTPEELAVIYGENLEDVLAPARLAEGFAKTHRKEFAIIGGIFDNNFKNQAEMVEIASIPSREVLISKIAFLLQSPMQRLAVGISEVAKTKN